MNILNWTNNYNSKNLFVGYNDSVLYTVPIYDKFSSLPCFLENI